MIFGFSLYTIPLQVVLVIYYRRVLGKLRRLKLLKGSRVCCHQYQKLVLLLIDSQDKAITV